MTNKARAVATVANQDGGYQLDHEVQGVQIYKHAAHPGVIRIHADGSWEHETGLPGDAVLRERGPEKLRAHVSKTSPHPKVTEAFDPNQPRDDDGKFASTGGGGGRGDMSGDDNARTMKGKVRYSGRMDELISDSRGEYSVRDIFERRAAKAPVTHEAPSSLIATEKLLDPGRVEYYRKQIRAGKKIQPALGYQRRGEKKIIIVDGHHRVEALQAEGKTKIPIRVGRAPEQEAEAHMSNVVDRIMKEPVVLNPLEFSPETSALIEALSEGDDDRPFAFRNVGKKDELKPGEEKPEDGEEKPGDEHQVANQEPVDPNDPEHIEPEDDVEIHDEDERASSPADWSTVSTKRARQFLHDHPEASIEIVFPTVFEEDRSAKIADLDAAYTAKTISHQRMAEAVAKELGFEQYNYDEEMQTIEEQKPPQGAGGLGSGDDILADLLGKGASGGDSTPPGAGAPGITRRGPADPLNRNSLRDLQPGEGNRDELATLRQDERVRTAEAGEKKAEAVGLSEISALELQIAELKRELELKFVGLTEAMTALIKAATARQVVEVAAPRPADIHIHNEAPIVKAQEPPVVNVEAPIVNIAPPDVNVEVHPPTVNVNPTVEVNMPPEGEREVTVVRDKQGLIKSATVRGKE